jgi:hypothetical protein
LATGPIEISLAYFVPDLSNSLLPLTHYVWLGYALITDKTSLFFECKKGNSTLCTGTTVKKVLIIDLLTPKAFLVKSDPIALHNSLGHPSLPYLKAAYPNLHITSLDFHVCNVSKMHWQPFPGSFPLVKHLLDRIHMDICGPITPASQEGNIYFLKIIDSHSKFRFIYPITRGEEGPLPRECHSLSWPWFWSELCQNSITNCWWTIPFNEVKWRWNNDELMF